MRAKHQFKYNYDETDLEEYSPVEITMEMPGDVTLTQMLYNFERYLQACGFVFDGKLDFVKDEDIWPSDSDDCCAGGCGCEVTSSPLETSEFNKQFDVTKTTASSKDSISVEGYQKRRNWTQAEKMLKEWNEGIAKLDNEQLQKAMKTAHEMSGLHYEATKDVVKNNWVHGMCNPPSPDWKKKK